MQYISIKNFAKIMGKKGGGWNSVFEVDGISKCPPSKWPPRAFST
jgi:hypothetical protein